MRPSVRRAISPASTASKTFIVYSSQKQGGGITRLPFNSNLKAPKAHNAL
jgi:hypothetical protein